VSIAVLLLIVALALALSSMPLRVCPACPVFVVCVGVLSVAGATKEEEEYGERMMKKVASEAG